MIRLQGAVRESTKRQNACIRSLLNFFVLSILRISVSSAVDIQRFFFRSDTSTLPPTCQVLAEYFYFYALHAIVIHAKFSSTAFVNLVATDVLFFKGQSALC